MAEHAMAFLAVPEVAARPEPGGVLLASLEMETEPLHIAVVGARDDPRTRALLAEALAMGLAYKRVELVDRREGPGRNADVEYPSLPFPAAFLCTSGRCSAPARTPEELKARAARVKPAPSSHVVELGIDARR
jgi:uncharacterized protein YyaL (SSP411 family)